MVGIAAAPVEMGVAVASPSCGPFVRELPRSLTASEEIFSTFEGSVHANWYRSAYRVAMMLPQCSLCPGADTDYGGYDGGGVDEEEQMSLAF